jgi:hypothetical protein
MQHSFDLLTFYHALYVAFAYSWLAFGATAYRQIIDNFSIKDSRLIKMGEDIYFTYDPLMMVWIASFVVLAIVSGMVAFVWMSFPHIELYCVPLGFMINIVQLWYRMKQQRLRVRTFGLIGRNIFEEGMRAIAYEHVHLIEVERDPIWSTVTIYYSDEAETEKKTDVKTLKRRILPRSLPKFLAMLEQKTTAKIFDKGDSPIAPIV